MLSLVTFKLNDCTNLQKLTVNKVGLAYHYVRAVSIIEKPGVLVAKPFLNYCFQKFTSNLKFIAYPCQATSLLKDITTSPAYFLI